MYYILIKSFNLMIICLLIFFVSWFIQILIKKVYKINSQSLTFITFGMFILTLVIFLILMIGTFILRGIHNNDDMIEPILEVIATTVSIMASGLLGIATFWNQNNEKKRDYLRSLLPYFSIKPSKSDDFIVINFGSEDTKVPLQFVDVYSRIQSNNPNCNWDHESYGSVWAKEDINYEKQIGNYDLIISAMTIKKQRVYFIYAKGISENVKIENNNYILYPTGEKASSNIINLIKSIDKNNICNCCENK